MIVGTWSAKTYGGKGKLPKIDTSNLKKWIQCQIQPIPYIPSANITIPKRPADIEKEMTRK
jgi:hypothetical protein